MASGTDHLSDEIPFPAPVTKKPRGTFDLTEPQADTLIPRLMSTLEYRYINVPNALPIS